MNMFDFLHELWLSIRAFILEGKTHKSKRQQLVNRIYKHFVMTQKSYTTSESLLFPTCYDVFIREEDFKFHEQSLNNTAQDVKKMVIRRVHQLRKRYPDYVAHSRHLVFSFICQKKEDTIAKEVLDQLDDVDKDGSVLILSKIYASLNQKDDEDGEEPVAMTIHTRKKVLFKQLDINKAILRNYETKGNSNFWFPFSLDGDIVDDPSNLPPVATLRAENSHFLIDGQSCRTYEMCSDILLISGRVGAPDTNGQEIARIDSDVVMNPHLIIRRNIRQGIFEIMSNGDAFLNEVSLPNFTNTWTLLPNNSELLINGEIQLIFRLP